MLDIAIKLPAGKLKKHTLELGRYTLGRGFVCDIRIPHKSVARHHATIEIEPNKQTLCAAHIDAAVYLNDECITEHNPLQKGEVFRFGDCTLEITDSLIEPMHCNQVQGDLKQLATEPSKPVVNLPEMSATVPYENADETASYARLTSVRKEIQEQVQIQMDLYKRNLISEMSAEELRAEARRMAEQVIKKGTIKIPSGVDTAKLIDEVVAEAIGLGPIEPLLADDTITEVMVNGPEHVYIERSGKLQQASVRFIDDRSLMSAIERIVTPLGRRIDEGVPMVDARLADGSRVNAIIPPLSLVGPVITIRKFAKKRFNMRRLIEIGSLSPQMVEFLQICVDQRRNIVISGGTGSGKTTFLNALSDYIPDNERIVTIEDAAELRLNQQHVISLEARPSNVEGKGQVSIRDLVRNALRMRPDRIIVGECRGGEALDMLQAMNTGHDGSLTTGHANSPRDLLSRLEVMVLMSGMDLPIRAIREQIASAVNIVVQQTRFKDGKRRVTDIVEIDGMESDVILMQKLFEFKQHGIGPNGEIQGDYVGLECAPRFYTELERAGVTMDRRIFDGVWRPPGSDQGSNSRGK